MSFRFTIDDDIRRATLPPSGLYGDPGWHAAVVDSVLAPAWTLLHEVHEAPVDASAVPLTGATEPLLWTRAEGVERVLSNVCTHRGATVVDGPCRVRTLRCPYHGRRWHLDGTLAAAPGFEDAADFPRPADDLAAAALERFGPWRFGALRPAVPFDAWIGPVRDRLGWYPWDALAFDRANARDYEIDVAWPLYVDNYLEGFHVPYVHPGLSQVLDPTLYRNELLPHGTLQIGIARDGEDAFEAPEVLEERVAGYYFWLFPTTMINVYPWGVSLNLVQPLGPGRTRIAYRFWIADPARRDLGAGADLDTVEREDQAIVARAQAGVRASLYPGGRYAPRHEVGLHHFHRLLARALG